MDKLTDKTFQFELVSPEQVLASEQVYMVEIPGEAGNFGVLADHAPLLSSVRPGVVTITAPDMTQRQLFVAGGFADVTGKACSLLAEEAVPLSELNAAKLEEELTHLKDDLGFAKDDQVKAQRIYKQIAVVEAKLAALRERQAA